MQNPVRQNNVFPVRRVLVQRKAIHCTEMLFRRAGEPMYRADGFWCSGRPPAAPKHFPGDGFWCSGRPSAAPKLCSRGWAGNRMLRDTGFGAVEGHPLHQNGVPGRWLSSGDGFWCSGRPSAAPKWCSGATVEQLRRILVQRMAIRCTKMVFRSGG